VPPAVKPRRHSLRRRKEGLRLVGALKKVAFKRVSPDDWDVYDVGFENTAMKRRLYPNAAMKADFR
jgi:hypothetical protein